MYECVYPEINNEFNKYYYYYEYNVMISRIILPNFSYLNRGTFRPKFNL